MYLTTPVLVSRVLNINEYDYENLRQLMRYVKGMINLFCWLGATDLKKIISHIDASYTAYPNFKSYTGTSASFGIGIVLL